MKPKVDTDMSSIGPDDIEDMAETKEQKEYWGLNPDEGPDDARADVNPVQERYHEYMQRMYREEREPQIWTVKIWKDDYDNYVLPIPNEILETLELSEGDTLKFDDGENGIFRLTKG